MYDIVRTYERKSRWTIDMAPNKNSQISTKDRIIRAFATCIQKKGIAAVTLRDVAKKANVSLGTIHYYFGTRENLVIELLNYQLDFIQRDIHERFQEVAPPGTKLAVIFEEGKEFIGTDLWLEFVEIWTAATRNKKMKESFALFYERLSVFIGVVLEEGMQAGLFRNLDKDAIADSIIAFVEGMGLQAGIRGKAHVNASFDLAVDSFIHYLKVVSEPPDGYFMEAGADRH